LPDPAAVKRREGELDVAELLSKLRDPNCGLEVRDRKKGLRTVKRAFVGTQFVDWLLANGFTKTGTRAEAVAIASALLNSNDLECKSDDHGPVFSDGAVLYVKRREKAKREVKRTKVGATVDDKGKDADLEREREDSDDVIMTHCCCRYALPKGKDPAREKTEAESPPSTPPTNPLSMSQGSVLQ
jgi:hypothetical protein